MSIQGELRQLGIEANGNDLELYQGILKARNVLPVNGNGQIFYASRANGSDDYTGKTINIPFATLQAAVNACTDWRGDQVMVLCDAASSTTFHLDESLACNCPGLTIRGLDLVNPFNPEQNMMYFVDGSDYDGTAVLVTKPTIFIGLTFASAAADTYPIVNLDGTSGGMDGANFCAFINCRFVNWSGAPYAVQCYGAACNTFYGCVFEGYGGAFDAGIYLRNDADGSHGANFNEIVNCKFVGCTYAVTVASGATANDTLIKGCTCIDSKLLAANSAGNGLVTCNYLETATNTGSYDDTVDHLNADGWNFSGNYYAE